MTPADAIDDSHYRKITSALFERLFPICRSITGEGLRKSLRIIGEHISTLQFIEMPSGTAVFDWVIPLEWNINDAYIKNSKGDRIVDFRKSNLHVISYSVPIKRRMSLEELKPHLHYVSELPKAIPYLTSYYTKEWGFCISYEQFKALPDDNYDVCIDSNLKSGSLTLAETVLPGEEKKEILLSSYCCHPSMANNELSGPVTMALLYQYLASLDRRRYTFRFYLGPETIGALAYLSLRGRHLMENLQAGFVLTCCGDRGRFTYKQPRDNPSLDHLIRHVLQHSNVNYDLIPFFPTGSDDRQYCSPGFNLPVVSIMRSVYGKYKEYHTSLDDLDFVSVDSILETFRVYINVIYALEQNRTYKNLKPWGEPHLKKYGLYDGLGGQKSKNEYTRIIRYLLNFSDGKHDLIDIANKLDLPLWEMETAVRAALQTNLIVPV